MSAGQDNFYNLSERIEDAFPEIDNDIGTDLFHNNSEYADLRKEAGKIQAQYPVIETVLEGSGAISLSADEHSALVQYIALSKQIEDMERRQIYFRGHTDGYAYLKKIGAL